MWRHGVTDDERNFTTGNRRMQRSCDRRTPPFHKHLFSEGLKPADFSVVESGVYSARFRQVFGTPL